nr:retrovirus-related Pol polyprotein from transposon TNT 1-94 [Tanacetum cinerariifolium]
MTFDETPPSSKTSPLVDDDLDEEEATKILNYSKWKSAFFNGFINEVYVAQLPGFIDIEKPDHVYKIKKALCGLKQALKACQFCVNLSDEGQMLIEFVIQNQFFFYTIEEFGQILGIPFDGACSFSDKWSLDDLRYSFPMSGPYQIDPPFPDDIKIYIQKEREGLVTRIHHKKTRKDYDTRRGRSSTSSSSAFGQPSSSHPNDDDNDGNNEWTLRASTPSPTYFVNSLTNEVPQIFLNPPNVDPTLEPFYTHQTKILNHQSSRLRSIRKDNKDLWRKKKKNTSSSFESKPQSSPPSSSESPFPQPSNPFLDNILDAPPMPSNLIPLLSYPLLDITLSISPLTHTDHLLESPLPPSPPLPSSPPSLPPQPQPPIMGHPIYFSAIDYHGANCLCFHNQNLILSLIDEMHFMFSHLEYLLTSSIASTTPPHP